tara:strand:+ start:687 stop:863 length:177 start_codon:yes stop_codon:yes gene_type:complete
VLAWLLPEEAAPEESDPDDEVLDPTSFFESELGDVSELEAESDEEEAVSVWRALDVGP